MGTVALVLAILLGLITGYLFIADHEQPTALDRRRPRLEGGRPAGPATPTRQLALTNDPATAIGQVEALWTQGLLTEAEYGEWRRDLLDAM